MVVSSQLENRAALPADVRRQIVSSLARALADRWRREHRQDRVADEAAGRDDVETLVATICGAAR
jgi:hypothetical protein